MNLTLLPNAHNLPQGAVIALIGAASAVPTSAGLVVKTRQPRVWLTNIGMGIGFLAGIAVGIALVLFLDSAFGIDFFRVRKGPVAVGMMCLMLGAGSGYGVGWFVELLTAKRVEVEVPWTGVRINKDGSVALFLWDDGDRAAVAQLDPPTAAALEKAKRDHATG